MCKPPSALPSVTAQAVAGGKAAASKAPFASSVQNFYMTDIISRASKVCTLRALCLLCPLSLHARCSPVCFAIPMALREEAA